MHNAHVFLFQCPLPSSCNDSYFIAAFPTLCSSLPVQIQSVSIHTICCMCMHFLPNVWAVHVCPLHSSNVYTYIKDSLCFRLFPSLVPRLHTRVTIERGDLWSTIKIGRGSKVITSNGYSCVEESLGTRLLFTTITVRGVMHYVSSFLTMSTLFLISLQWLLLHHCFCNYRT
jgi:hypothetical protein